MFRVKHISNKDNLLEYIELSETNGKSSARICLGMGGSMQLLTLNERPIIKSLDPLSYKSTYASAILFPFTNRIKNGTYMFKEKHFALNINSMGGNNALHGLVYDKKFEIIKFEESSNFASITICYNETTKTKGFPFKYKVWLTYILTFKKITLKVSIENTDDESFPFNIGWHPYFWSSDLYNSFLSLKSDKKLIFDNEMIPLKVEKIDTPEKMQIKNTLFDDCYILNDSTITFKTPNYEVDICSSSTENYLQLFTPKKPNTIAIEPKTAPSNSFNNKLGLKELSSGGSYEIEWSIKLINIDNE